MQNGRLNTANRHEILRRGAVKFREVSLTALIDTE